MDHIPLTPHQAINFLLTITPRFGMILMWTTFAAFHLALCVMCLLCLWFFQISPRDISEWTQQAFQTESARTASAVLAFAGLSGLALVLFYVRIWRRIYGTLTASFLMQGL